MNMARKSHFNPDKYNSPLATRIREEIENRNISGTNLAEQIDVSPAAVSQFLTGKSAPKLDTLVKIADAFGVTTDYLLGRTDDPKDQRSIIDDTGLTDQSISVLNHIKRVQKQEQSALCLINKIICSKYLFNALFYSDMYLAALQAEKIQEHFSKNIVSVAGEIDLITGATDEEVLRLEKEQKKFDDVMANVIESCMFGSRITEALQKQLIATKQNEEKVESIAAINAILYGGKILSELVDESLAEVDAKIKELE